MNASSTVELLLHVSRRMVESKDRLTQADKMGDADHGIGMARGFHAVEQSLTRNREEGRVVDLQQLFVSVGSTLLASIGGAAGPIFGSFFRGFSGGFEGQSTLNSAALAQGLNKGREAVMKIGKALPGDKTMLDALDPAARRALAVAREPLDSALAAVAAAAGDGMAQTENMVARVGKAKTLGERTLGHPDPGAVSMFLILQFLAEYVAQL